MDNNSNNKDDNNIKRDLVDGKKEEVQYTNNSNDPHGYRVEPERKKKKNIIIPIFLGIIAVLLLINLVFMAAAVFYRKTNNTAVSEDYGVTEVEEMIITEGGSIENFDSSLVQTQQLIGGVSEIEVDVLNADIEIINEEDAGQNTLVKIYSKNKNDYVIEKDGNELKVASKKDEVIRYFSFGEYNTDKITIYLPKNNVVQLDDINIVNVSGDTIIENVKFEELDIKTTSGNVDLFDVTLGDAEIKTVSGDVNFFRVYANKKLDVKSTSGQLYFDGADITDELILKTISGDVMLMNVKARKSEIDTTSGLVTGENVSLQQIIAKSVSGDFDLQFQNLSSLSGEVKTVSGDAIFYLPEGFLVNVIGKNNAGSIVNTSDSTNTIKTETVSGDMRIGMD